jgi:hypothetical protein
MKLKTALKKQSSMTKRKRTDKSKYKHQTTGDHCTCAAYLAEMMCLRLAEYKNEGNLTYKFWNNKPWDWTFKQQMFAANSLIKKYGEKAVVRAVANQKSIFSLKNRRLLPEINKQVKLIEQEQTKPAQELDVKKEAKTRKKSYGKKSGLNKLRGLDNGKKESQE